MNRFLFTSVVILIAHCAQAQWIIPKAGMTFNYNQESINGSSAKPGVGFLLGFAYNVPMKGHLSFQPEFYFVLKSFKIDYSTSQTTGGQFPQTNTAHYADKYHVSYLELPVLFRYKFKQEKMYAVLGPYLGIGLGGYHSYNYQTQYGSQPPNAPVSGSDNVMFGALPSGSVSNTNFDRRWDFGFQGGVGFIVNKKIQVELRTGLGLIGLKKSIDSRNETVMLTAAFPFSVGERAQ